MRENRAPHSTVYFCGNCEDELTGIPAGTRIPDRRPLCARCTDIGIEDGWAVSGTPCGTQRVYANKSFPGAVFLIIIVAVIGILLASFLGALDQGRK